MQRIYPCALSPEAYREVEGHRQVRAEAVCPRCGQCAGLDRHGVYARGVTAALGKVVVILVARFLCRACGRTVSYLPDFALSYRVVAAATFQAYLQGEHQRREVQHCGTLLQQYRRQMDGFASELWRVVGCGLGRAPPVATTAVWPWLKEACGSLTDAARRLVREFKIGLFRRYQCHQPAGP